jgi:hypothetical protein
MARRGIEEKKRSVGMVYLGVGLAAEDDPE